MQAPIDVSVSDGTTGSPEPGSAAHVKYLQLSVQLQAAAQPSNVSPAFVQSLWPCVGPSHWPLN